MDNIYPNNIDRAIFFSRDKAKYIRAMDTCRNMINQQYIDTAFKNFQKGYLYKDEDGDFLGFCIWKEYKDIQKDGTFLKKLHITLICADYNDYNLGRKILYDIESYCINNNFSLITLEAANNDLVKYYEKGGFTLTNKITKEMIKEVKILTFHRKNSKTRKIKRTSIPSSAKVKTHPL